MKKHFHLLVLMLSVVLLLNSCRTAQKPSVTKVTTVKDSIVKRLVTMDTLQIIRPSDTVRINTLISKLSEVPIVQKSKYSQVSLKRVGNQIQAECISDELKELVQQQKQIITYYKEVNNQQQETIIEYQKFVPLFIKILAWVGGVVLLLIIALIVLLVINPKRLLT